MFFIGAHIVSASESFKNSLIKMDFSKIPSGGVQVKLYTNKPYGDSISVNKKNDSEYIILMPETSNSMTSNPILNPVSGIVRGVSVKTQQYENGVKGYTKITISTTKPVEIIPQVKSINVSDYQLSENDYSELLAQASKKPKTVVTQKAAVKPATAKKEAPKITQKLSNIKQRRVGFSSPNQKASHALNTTSHKKNKQIAVQPKTVIKPQIMKKPVSHLPVSTVENTLQTGQKPVSEPVTNTKVQTTEVPKQIQTNPAPQPQMPTQALTPPTFTQKLINIAENPRRLAKYKNVIEKNIYVIIGAILIVFLMLLLGARRMIKGLQRQKEAFAKNLEDKPAPTTNFMDKINKNMTWKEKYQTYVEASNQPAEPQTDIPSQPTETTDSPFEATQELNELFSADPEDTITQDNFTQENVANESISNEDELEQYESLEKELFAQTEVPQHEISRGEEVFGKDKLDELFGVDEDVFGENFEEKGSLDEDFSFGESFNEIQEETLMPASFFYETPIVKVAETEDDVETIKSEYVIDATKGFYLVDYKDSTALIGHIEDEIFVLKQFKEKIQGTLQARLDEHKGTSANYMTRVGNFKALVEVKPNDMNLLIEL